MRQMSENKLMRQMSEKKLIRLIVDDVRNEIESVRLMTVRD